MTMKTLQSFNYALSDQSLSFSSMESHSLSVTTTDSSIGIVYLSDSAGSWESNIKYDTTTQSITDLDPLAEFTLEVDLV